MTKRRYNFLRLTALLMIILGILGMLAGIVLGVILIVRPSLIMPGAPFSADVLRTYALTGAIVIVSSVLGGIVMAAIGQLYQVVLELLEVNRLQVKGLKAIADR